MKKEFETPKIVELGTLKHIVLQGQHGLPFVDALGPHWSAVPTGS